MAKIHFIVPNKINAVQSLENKQKISREKASHKKNETTMKITVSMCAESLQSRPTLCNPIGCSQSGSSVHGFSRQEYQSGLPCPPPGDLPDPGIKPTSLTFPALAGRHLPLEPLVGACKHTAVPRLHKRQTTKSPLCKRRAKCLNYREWHCPLTSSKCNIFTWFLSGTTHSQNK